MSTLSPPPIRVRDGLVRMLAPPAARTPVLETVLLLAIGVTSAFFRLGAESTRGTLWAEDGETFLSDAHRFGLLERLLTPYAGYPNTLHRVLSSFVAQMPILWQGVALCLAAAVVQGCLAVFLYHVVRAHVPRRIAALMVFVGVCAVPVAPEAAVNISNLQWFLMPAACVAAFWRPTTRAGVVASCLVLVAYVLSSPFGAAPVAIAAVVFLLSRERSAAALAGTGVVALVIEVAVMLSAPERIQTVQTVLDPGLAVRGYLARVTGDGVFGVARHDVGPSLDVQAGLLVVALVVALMLVVRQVAARSGEPDGDAVGFPGVLLALSVASFVLIMLLSGLDPASAYNGGRYVLPPTIFLLMAVAVLVERSLTARPADHVWLVRSGQVLAVALVVGVAYGTVASYSVADAYGRETLPTWGAQIEQARQVCRTTDADTVDILVAPLSWVAELPCSAVTAE